MSQPSVRVTLSSATFCRLASRYSSCSAICSTVLARRSLKNGDSLPAHSLHRLPSSSLRLPRSPISPPQMLQVFFSNIFPNSPMSRPFRRLQLRTPIMAEAGKAKKRPTARKGEQKRTERPRLARRHAVCVGVSNERARPAPNPQRGDWPSAGFSCGCARRRARTLGRANRPGRTHAEILERGTSLRRTLKRGKLATRRALVRVRTEPCKGSAMRSIPQIARRCGPCRG